MLRNCYDWDCHEETNFWEIICDTFYPIEKLPPKTRNQIRRCQRDCDIKMLTSYDLVKSQGYRVFKSAFERYHDITISIPDKETWESATYADKEHEFWGVFEKGTGELISYSVVTANLKCVGYNTLKAIPEKMNKHYPYFGLLYEMNRYYLAEMGCKYVSDGWRSVTEHSGIQPFLERNFLFRKAYVRMEMHYAIWLRIAVKALFPFRKIKIIPLIVRHLLKFEEINRQSCF